MKKLFLLLIFLSLIFLFKIGYIFIGLPVEETVTVVTPTPTFIPIPTPFSLNTDKLWSLIQDWRASEGLKPYIKDQRLCVISDQRVEEIQTDYSHDKFIERYKTSPYQISENIAADRSSEQETLDAWLASPFHAVALHKWTYSCTSCKNSYCVQIFSNF